MANTGDSTNIVILNPMVFIRGEIATVDPDDEDRSIYEINYTHVEDTLCVFLNGMRQREGIEYDYEILGDKQFRFNFSLEEEDVVMVDYIKIMTVSG